MKHTDRRAFLTGVAGVLGGSGLAAAQPRKHLLVSGGGPNRTVEYFVVVSDAIEKTGDGGDSPVADRYVTIDPDDKLQDGAIVRGTVAGGADAFRYTGEVINFGVSLRAGEAGAVRIYDDGRRVAPDAFGQHASAGTPMSFVDGRTVRVSGDWAEVRAHTTTMYADGVGTDYGSLGSVSGQATLSPTWNEDKPFALDSVELYDKEGSLSAVHTAENPFAGPWNLGDGASPNLRKSPESAEQPRTADPADEQSDAPDTETATETEEPTTETDQPTETETEEPEPTTEADDQPTTTEASEPLSNHVVIFGGGGSNTIEYEFTVSGEVEKDGSAGGAPIDDQYVTVDSEDTISGSTVRGATAGGGDAFRFSGEITSLSVSDGGKAYVNGSRRA
ncbi:MULTISPECIES: hypothetical protein [Halorussus]|uniref:hypothetical protein n=1 Tax=Halorussus TaxID=1070314 RepID=UPI00209D971C|nr:hypothetical protein [Halorussus vallis]USZ77487.1 hypothetical protein NGM07_09165 [Halorussus vallis]